MRDHPCRMDGLCAEVVEPSHYWEEPAAAWAVAESPAVYRPRHPERTAFYRLLETRFDRCLRAYEERFAPRSGPLRPVVVRSVEDSLGCGRPEGGFPESGARSAGRNICWPSPAAPGTTAPVARPNAPCCSPRS